MNLRKNAAIFVVLFLTLFTLTGCGGSQKSAEVTTSDAKKSTPVFSTVENGVLTMATNAQFPPYEYYNGNDIVGIDVEVAKAIADKLGLGLKIEDMEFESVISSVENSRVDIGITGITETVERKKSVNFTESYATCIQSVIVKKGSDIQSVEDLNGKRLGVQLLTTGDIYAVNDYGAENVEEYNKGVDAVGDLISGKIDCVIIDNESAKSFAADNEGIQILDAAYSIEEYVACVSKSNEELLAAVNRAIKELKEDGTIQNILDKYIENK